MPRYSARPVGIPPARDAVDVGDREPGVVERGLDHRRLERAAVLVELAGRRGRVGDADDRGSSPQRPFPQPEPLPPKLLHRECKNRGNVRTLARVRPLWSPSTLETLARRGDERGDARRGARHCTAVDHRPDAGDVVLPAPCLVVLVGPSGSGKSTWATDHFLAEQIVSSDRLRAIVGEGEEDLAASADAFALLEQIVAIRVGRRLTTVVDTLGLDPGRRANWIDLARRNRLATCRGRVRVDCSRVPGPQPRSQQAGRADRSCRNRCAQPRSSARCSTANSISSSHPRSPSARTIVRTAPAGVARVRGSRPRRPPRPSACGSGSRSPSYTWPGGARRRCGRACDAIAGRGRGRGLRQHLGDGPLPADPDVRSGVARHARELHRRSRPSPPSTERVRLGTLVTGVTYRNVGHLGKIVATLDVLSGGRAAVRHRARLVRTPSTSRTAGTSRRSTRATRCLEDALQVLPMLWGKGSPPFEGRAICRARHDVLSAAAAGARPSARRRQRRAAHAPARRAVRGCVQHHRRCRRRHQEARRAACALRCGRPRSGRRRGDATLHRRSSVATRPRSPTSSTVCDPVDAPPSATPRA